MPDNLKTQELSDFAVKQNVANLAYVPEALKTPELCELAIQESMDNFRYVSETFKTPKLCIKAVRHKGDNLEYVPEALKTPALCLAAIMEESSGIDYVPATMTFTIQVTPQENGTALLANVNGVQKRVWASRLIARGFSITDGTVQLSPALYKLWFNPNWMEEKKEELHAVLENPGKIRVENVARLAHTCPMTSSVGSAQCALMRKYFKLFVEKGIMTEKGEWV
jgi:hypothetical protein